MVGWIGAHSRRLFCGLPFCPFLISVDWIGLEHLQLQHLKERPYFHFRGWFLDFEGQFFFPTSAELSEASHVFSIAW
jgi:hypothetical protein